MCFHNDLTIHSIAFNFYSWLVLNYRFHYYSVL